MVLVITIFMCENIDIYEMCYILHNFIPYVVKTLSPSMIKVMLEFHLKVFYGSKVSTQRCVQLRVTYNLYSNTIGYRAHAGSESMRW